MKKLMTMLAAVGMAFGLFAQELPDPIVDADNFATTDQEAFAADAQWKYNGTDTKPADKVWVANNLLNLATGSGKVQRTFVSGGAATVEDAIYFDANINFEDPFDEVPVISDSDNAKIAAFVLDNSGIIEELGTAAKVAPSTNLYAIAAYNNGGTWEKRAFMFATPADEGIADKFAKRLTIKAYGDVMDGAATRMGFRFFLNGDTDIKNALAVKYVFPINDDGSIDFTTFIDADDTTTPYLGDGVKASLKAAVRSRCSDQTLVLALEESAAELLGFDLAGKGELAKFTLTNKKFDFIAEDAYTMTVDYENAEFDSISPDTIPYEGGTITFYDDTQITLTVTPDENYTIVKWFLNDGEEVVHTGTSYTFTPVNLAQLQVKAYKEEATLTYTDDQGEAKTVNCTSVIDAFAKAGELEGATDIKIKLGQFAGEEGVITIADEAQSIYGITVTGDVTLDLAGKILKGGSTDATGTFDATITLSSGSLAVIDSIGGGAIVDPEFTYQEGVGPYAVNTYSDMITFSACDNDKFYTIGTICPDAFSASAVSIADGKFEKTNEKSAIEEALASDDLEVVGDEDEVWTVQMIQGFTVTVPNAEPNTKLAVAIDGEPAGTTGGDYPVDKGSTLTAVYTADTGYTLDGKGDWTVDYETKDTKIEAPTATIKTFTVTFKPENGEQDIVEDNVAYGTEFNTVKPEDPTKTGYTFTGWDPAGVPVTADATYTAQYTANNYDINYTWVDNDGAQVTALDNTLPTQFTFGGESITLNKSMVTLTEAYTDVEFAPATVTTDKAEAFAVTVTLTKKAEDPLPPWVPQTEKGAYDTWKAGPGATESDFTGAPEVVAKKMEDSFLLNCAPTEEALQTAKANFKITSITKDDSGNWVVLTVDKADGQPYGNGLIKLEAFESVGCETPVTPDDQSQLFWKAKLVHPTAN